MMELRVAGQDDWQGSRGIRLRALAEDPSAFCATLEQESALTEAQWRNRMSTSVTLLAWDGANPVGTVTIKPDPHEAGGRELVALWVDPAHRRTGLADSLVASVVELATADGAHEVALWVAEDNVRARALYARSGFDATGERDVMRPGVDQVRMRKDFSEAATA